MVDLESALAGLQRRLDQQDKKLEDQQQQLHQQDKKLEDQQQHSRSLQQQLHQQDKKLEDQRFLAPRNIRHACGEALQFALQKQPQNSHPSASFRKQAERKHEGLQELATQLQLSTSHLSKKLDSCVTARNLASRFQTEAEMEESLEHQRSTFRRFPNLVNLDDQRFLLDNFRTLRKIYEDHGCFGLDPHYAASPKNKKRKATGL